MTLFYVIPLFAIGALILLVAVARSRAAHGETWVKGKRPENLGKKHLDKRPQRFDPNMEDLMEAVRINIERNR